MKTLLNNLLSDGGQVVAHGPEGLDEAGPQREDRVTFADDGYDVGTLVIDGRKTWSGYGVRTAGCTYDAIGAKGS